MKFPEQFRWNGPNPQYHSKAGNTFGAFLIPSFQDLRSLKVIAIDGLETGWDHVSVSLPSWPNKTPSWAEMCYVKSLFWESGDCVVQFHPPDKDYVNVHNGCLHMWKMVDGEFPTPPKECV